MPIARCTKAVIPAAGLGTRFLPATKAQPKEMLALVDKPTIQYVVEEAARNGLRDVLVITSGTKRSIEDHFDRAYELEDNLTAKGKTAELEVVRAITELAKFHYVRQGEPLGLGHAVGIARHHVGDNPFAVMLGDDVMVDGSPVLGGMLDACAAQGASVVALMEVDPSEISSYGCAAVESVGGGDLVLITDIVEKPPTADAPSNLAVVGRYVFTPQIFDCIDAVSPGKGGEIQLTDAIALLMKDQKVFGYVFKGGRFDVGHKLDYLRANIELALERNDLGEGVRRFIAEIAQREQL